MATHKDDLLPIVGRRVHREDARAGIPRRDPGHEVPLSLGQQRLWFLDQLHPDPAYTMPAVLQVTGPLDVGLVRRSLAAVITRHEVLRTTFPAIDGRPYQQITTTTSEVPLTVVDLSHLRGGQRQAAADELVRREITRTFDLAAGPLLRAVVIRLGASAHLMVLNLHHIIADAWSMRVFIREISECYRAFGGGGPADLPALAVQYA
ncbi:MAG TPA: condensation domain-containing protein, partial [Euzebya sp.]|nr:condensation domain-containing protein [Euzebya sp.]